MKLFRLIRRILVGPVIAALVLSGAFGATPALADAVVGHGHAADCDETAFDTAFTSGGLITFNCGAAPVIITFTGPKTVQAGDVTIDGGGLITLSGGNSTRLFNVRLGFALTLRNVVLEKGNSGSNPAGAVYNNHSTLILDHATIQDSHNSNLPGGAIHSDGGAITLTNNSLIQNNSAYNYGAINTTGSLVLINSIIRDNTATYSGGGLALGGVTTINHSQIYSNTANGSDFGGAGLYLGASSVVAITDTQIYNNNAFVGEAHGSGIKNFGALTVNHSSLSGNFAFGGGGISNEVGATATLDQVTFTGNSASTGGALYNAGTLTLTQSTVIGNLAPSGGGLENGGGTATIVNSTFSGNRAQIGAGIDNDGRLTLTNDTLSGNLATEDGGIYGGGLASTGGTVTLTNLTLSGNAAPQGAGIFFNTGNAADSLTVLNTLVADNLAGGNCTVGLGSLANIASAGFNLSSDSSCEGYFNQGGDQNGQPAHLFALANNGGFTRTHLPQHNSPAIDNGTGAGCPAADQRGLQRPRGAACDIGAVEVQSTDLVWPLDLPLVRR